MKKFVDKIELTVYSSLLLDRSSLLDGLAMATIVIHEGAGSSVDTQNSRQKNELSAVSTTAAEPEEITSLSPLSQEPSVLSMVSVCITTTAKNY